MNRFWMPEIAAEHGQRIDDALFLVHWFMLALFVGWILFFLYALYRFRRSRNPVADYRGVTSHRNTWVEVGVVVVEAVLLVGFSIPLWAQRVDDFPAESEATVVRVVAQGNGFAVSSDAQALSAGVIGQVARVRMESGRIRTGTVLDARTVQLDM